MKNKESLNSGLIFVLVVALIVAFSQINSLKSDIRMLDNDLANEKSRLENQISSIYTNVDNQLKKEASLFANVVRNYGELDEETKTASINFTVLPKVITDDMKVNISVGSKSAEMVKKDNGEYTANIPVGLFENLDYFPIVTIKSKGETKTEILESQSVQYIWTSYLPTVNGGNIRPSKVSLPEGKLTVDGKLVVGYNIPSLNKDVKFTKYSLNVEVSGKEISSKDITSMIRDYEKSYGIDGGRVEIPFKETYDLMGSDNLSIYLVAEDSLGYIHKNRAFSWEQPDSDGAQKEMAVPIGYGGETILDKDGNVLFGKNEAEWQ